MNKPLRNVAFLFACLFLLNTTAFAVDEISPQSSAYIFGTSTNMVAGRNGNMTISFAVSSPTAMTELGASSIDIYEVNGRSTTLVETVYSSDPNRENMLGNGTYHSSNITYTGIIGYAYYAEVHFTARNSTGGDNITKTTPTVTAKK